MPKFHSRTSDLRPNWRLRDHRLLATPVEKGVSIAYTFPPGAGRRAARLERDAGGVRRRALREQVADHPAPGPAALTDGLNAMHALIARCARRFG